MTYTLLANYEKEQALLSEFVRSDKEPNILLLQGESGSGKSSLLEYCRDIAPDVPFLMLTLENEGDSIPALFSLMGARCGWQKLPRFIRTVATLLETPDNVDDPNWRGKMHRHLREIGKISDLESRLSRYQLLSDAWFDDAMQFETPFLLTIDGYKAAPTLFKKWFSQDFLIGVANSQRMRVVVAGQEIPSRQTGWSSSAILQELKGIPKTEIWLAWAEKIGYRVPSFETLEYLVQGMEGKPGPIAQVIHSQSPKVSNSIAPARYERIKNNLIEYFKLEDLQHTICPKMAFSFEILPNHGYRLGLVRELLAYVERNGRLDELIQICRTERPHLEW